jgi:hypothetical protein
VLLPIHLRAALPPILSTHCFEIGAFPLNFVVNVGYACRGGGVVIGKGVGQRGGQADIMMCGCDGGWNGGDRSLKSVFEWIWAANHGF